MTSGKRRPGGKKSIYKQQAKKKSLSVFIWAKVWEPPLGIHIYKKKKNEKEREKKKEKTKKEKKTFRSAE